jgi:hypothetical protein
LLLVFLLTLLVKVTGSAGSEKISEGAGMLISVLVIAPLAFLIGSFITGYFSYYDIEHKWSLLWMAPALYLELAGVCLAVVKFLLDRFIDVNPLGPHFIQGLLMSVAGGLYWYLASAGGVFLGYFLRERFAKWWYGD